LTDFIDSNRVKADGESRKTGWFVYRLCMKEIGGIAEKGVLSNGPYLVQRPSLKGRVYLIQIRAQIPEKPYPVNISERLASQKTPASS
jgi:hypothetical protein